MVKMSEDIAIIGQNVVGIDGTRKQMRLFINLKGKK